MVKTDGEVCCGDDDGEIDLGVELLFLREARKLL